ncbi:hypothetical protein P8452_38540 [Trifolium repens]|nr:hypothetical protein P8452_38540 [Trifolium repens]
MFCATTSGRQDGGGSEEEVVAIASRQQWRGREGAPSSNFVFPSHKTKPKHEPKHLNPLSSIPSEKNKSQLHIDNSKNV